MNHWIRMALLGLATVGLLAGCDRGVDFVDEDEGQGRVSRQAAPERAAAGGSSEADEVIRERSSLEALPSQPVRRIEVLWGKFAGTAIALLAALALGSGVTALLLGLRGGSGGLWRYLSIFGFSVLLAWAMLSVGVLISTLARGSALAIGLAIFTWLALVFLGDLGLMTGTVALRLSSAELLAVALANPVQVFKLLAVSGIQRSLDLLLGRRRGDSGAYAAGAGPGRVRLGPPPDQPAARPADDRGARAVRLGGAGRAGVRGVDLGGGHVVRAGQRRLRLGVTRGSSPAACPVPWRESRTRTMLGRRCAIARSV